MKKSSIIKLSIIAVLVVVIATALLFAYKKLISGFIVFENKNVVEYGSLQTVPDGEALFILENSPAGYNAKVMDGKYYIKFETVQSLFNDQFSVDKKSGNIYYTIPTMNMCITPDVGIVAEYGRKEDFGNYKPVVTVNGELYMDTEFVSKYSDVTFSFYDHPNRMVVYYQHKENLYYKLADETPFHSTASVKSEIYDVLPAGTIVSYIGGTGSGKADFYYIMTADGRFGYVQKKHLLTSFYQLWQSEFREPEQVHMVVPETIRLGWHYTGSQKGNETYDTVVKNTEGMNVYSPRWMYVADNSGNLTNYGEAQYVKKAHDAGYQVWVLVQDFDGPESLDIAVLLADREARKRLAENMVNETVALGADGINLDLEKIDKNSAKDFIQFVKELSIMAHMKNLVLSVDNLVPLGYNTYELDVQAKYADYIVIMAYDEHYAGSSEAGSVASIGYTKKALANTIAKVPRNQIVISVPFYTRLWETDAQGALSSSAVSMLKANAHVAKNNFEKKWDADTCQYYVSYTLSNIKYEMWLEDSRSLTMKLEAIRDANVAGMAAWRLGFEEDDTWKLITSIIE